MTRLLCVGDLHLGAGSDYGREPGDRLRDQEAVWARALELAEEHRVDAVLFTGDAFHRRRPTPAEMIAFQRPLRDTDVDVVAIAGNHDSEAADLPTALDVFGRELSLYTQPGVWQVADGSAAIACLPWAPVTRLVATRNGGDRDDLNREAAGLLVAAARGLRAQIPAEQTAVLMAHWSVTGASTPTGVMTDEFREVVLDLGELEALGFDAVVLGHIHKAQEMAPGIFYTGSPAPVDFGEATVEHGCFLLDIDGGCVSTSFLPIESRPFVTVDVDVTAAETPPHAHNLVVDALEAVDLNRAVVRIRYRATEEQARAVEHQALAHVVKEDGGHKLFAIQPDIVRPDRARVAGVDEELAPLSALDLWLEAEQLNGWERDSLRQLSARYLEAVGA